MLIIESKYYLDEWHEILLRSFQTVAMLVGELAVWVNFFHTYDTLIWLISADTDIDTDNRSVPPVYVFEVSLGKFEV